MKVVKRETYGLFTVVINESGSDFYYSVHFYRSHIVSDNEKAYKSLKHCYNVAMAELKTILLISLDSVFKNSDAVCIVHACKNCGRVDQSKKGLMCSTCLSLNNLICKADIDLSGIEHKLIDLNNEFKTRAESVSKVLKNLNKGSIE